MSSSAPRFSLARLKKVIFGAPIPTNQAHNERLSPFIGLPVFSSDALSSVAYATEAILGILVLAGAWALGMQLWVTAAICGLIVVIAISYNQTIHAYPSGGGSYIVASENLGEPSGLVAGAALLIDYVLTVSVSVAAGVAALVSAFPALHPYLTLMSVGFIGLVAWANLRGVKESGVVFAIPTYAFIFGVLTTIVFGIFKTFGQPIPPPSPLTAPHTIGSEMNLPLIFVVLRSFAAGCTALTGIEAVSNGVQAFRPPESKNASLTLRWMATLLLLMFLGTGFISMHLPHIELYPTSDPKYTTVLSQVASFAFGGSGNFGFYFIQFSTAAILILAANTAFADFPRLGSLIARDGYLPRPLARQGDRLVFHNGILVLAVAASLLVWHFKGELDALLPLYAVGVFTAFTLSQMGMVVHWFRLKTTGWQTSAAINGFGAFLSLAVLFVILGTKFLEGAWIVAVLIPVIFASFKLIKGRYDSISRQLEILQPPTPYSSHVRLLMVPRVHMGILHALEYAKMDGVQCVGMHVVLNDKRLPDVQRQWEEHSGGIPLVVLRSPFRSLITPILDYVDSIQARDPNCVVSVIVPEAISTRWWHKLLQENVTTHLKNALGSRKNVVVTNVRYFLE